MSVLTGTQVLLLVVSETGLVYTFTTPKLQPLVTKPEGKNLIQVIPNPFRWLRNIVSRFYWCDSPEIGLLECPRTHHRWKWRWSTRSTCWISRRCQPCQCCRPAAEHTSTRWNTPWLYDQWTAATDGILSEPPTATTSTGWRSVSGYASHWTFASTSPTHCIVIFILPCPPPFSLVSFLLLLSLFPQALRIYVSRFLFLISSGNHCIYHCLFLIPSTYSWHLPAATPSASLLSWTSSVNQQWLCFVWFWVRLTIISSHNDIVSYAISLSVIRCSHPFAAPCGQHLFALLLSHSMQSRHLLILHFFSYYRTSSVKEVPINRIPLLKLSFCEKKYLDRPGNRVFVV